MRPRYNILLIVTGSISAYKAASIASGLQKRDCHVQVMMTEAATKLITPATMSGITHNRTMLDEGWFNGDVEYVPHITMARHADIIFVCPASADFIAKLANGFADDLSSATCLAGSGMMQCKKTSHIILTGPDRMVIAPAMNSYMYESKVTKDNIEKLKSYGYEIIEPKVGHLACGDEGIGHLKGTREIIDELLGPEEDK